MNEKENAIQVYQITFSPGCQWQNGEKHWGLRKRKIADWF